LSKITRGFAKTAKFVKMNQRAFASEMIKSTSQDDGLKPTETVQ
jgi:hypothetical protein